VLGGLAITETKDKNVEDSTEVISIPGQQPEEEQTSNPETKEKTLYPPNKQISEAKGMTPNPPSKESLEVEGKQNLEKNSRSTEKVDSRD
jgi:hypothetical protein